MGHKIIFSCGLCRAMQMVKERVDDRQGDFDARYLVASKNHEKARSRLRTQ